MPTQGPDPVDLEFGLRPSEMWRRLQVVVTVTVGVLLMLLPLSIAFKGFLLVIVLLTFVAAGRSRQRVYQFSRLAQRGGCWYLRRPGDGDQRRRCRVEYISSLFIVLRVLADDQNRPWFTRLRFPQYGNNTTRLPGFRLPLFRDAMNAEDFQTLQLLVRNGRD